jgi:hypothetical protein
MPPTLRTRTANRAGWKSPLERYRYARRDAGQRREAKEPPQSARLRTHRDAEEGRPPTTIEVIVKIDIAKIVLALAAAVALVLAAAQGFPHVLFFG